MNRKWGCFMIRIFHCVGEAFKSLAHCYRETARQARESGENPRQFGFHEFRETEGGPPLFYTETCPEGTYLIGVMTDEGTESKGLKRPARDDGEENKDLIVPGNGDTSGPRLGTSEHPK